jgi:hypothetical protein
MGAPGGSAALAEPTQLGTKGGLSVIQPRWGVYALRKKAERIGSVMARDSKEPVHRALRKGRCRDPEPLPWRFSAMRLWVLPPILGRDGRTARHPNRQRLVKRPPSETRERIPDLLIRGQLRLTLEEQRRIRQGIEQTNVEEQPIPRAFAPAPGMTAPPELTLTPLPQDLQQVSGSKRSIALRD